MIKILMWIDNLWANILFPIFIAGVLLFAVGAVMVTYLGWPSFIATVTGCLFPALLVKLF